MQRPTPAAEPVDGPRPARPPESATFDSVRVAAGRARPPLFVIAFLVVLAGVVGIGLGGREAAAPAVLGSPIVFASPSSPASTPAVGPTPGRPSPPSMAVDGPVLTALGGPIELTAQRHPHTMYVHGDVFVEKVTWVFVSLQDVSGRVGGWASVSVPGAAGPNAGYGPTLRFDVELPVPSELSSGSMWIQVSAYDASGKPIATTRLGVDREGGALPEGGAVQQGFRPGVFFPMLDASWEDEP